MVRPHGLDHGDGELRPERARLRHRGRQREGASFGCHAGFMAWLLVAPRAQLTALVTTGSPVESVAERANIALALCTMCDQALEASKDDDGVTAASAESMAPSCSASASASQSLVRRRRRVGRTCSCARCASTRPRCCPPSPTRPPSRVVCSHVSHRDDNLLSFAALTTARASAGAGGARRACDRGGARSMSRMGGFRARRPSACARRARHSSRSTAHPLRTIRLRSTRP